MPDVMGLRLDVALSDIERAGFEGDDVEVLGGGTFGIVAESNWQVCDQSPAAGQAVTATPRLTVDRSCADDTAAPEASESEPAPTESQKVETLTIENNADLAALLAASGGEAYDLAEEFAAEYEGQLIEFDANVAFMAPSDDSETLSDMLIYVGDFSDSEQIGPSFKYDDVSPVLDLGFTGSNIPDSIGTGDHIRVVARVEEFNSDTGLFFLEPVATEMR